MILLISKISYIEGYKNANFEKKGHYCELAEEIFSRINENADDRKQYVQFMKDNPYIAKRKLINVNA